MKKLTLLSACFVIVLILSAARFIPNDNTVKVETKDAKMHDWYWTSGEVKGGTSAPGQAFTIAFNKSVYHAGDSIKITFNSYKVMFTGITAATTFERWISKNILVCSMNNTWVPLVKDTNARINKPFTGKNNNRTDSLVNYQIRTVVPANNSLVLTVSAGRCEMNMIDGHDKPMFTKGYQTLTTTIKGIEVEKL